jgi:hypothetical protein
LRLLTLKGISPCHGEFIEPCHGEPADCHGEFIEPQFHGVKVAQQILVLFVLVRIQMELQKAAEWRLFCIFIL